MNILTPCKVNILVQRMSSLKHESYDKQIIIVLKPIVFSFFHYKNQI